MFIDSDNRSFKYGDGFFETLRVHKNQILFWAYHQMRILESLACLRLQGPSFFSLQQLQAQILERCAGINSPNQRVRVTFFRTGGGRYVPQTDEMDYLIEAEPLQGLPFAPTPEDFTVGFCTDIRLPSGDALASCKTNSALRYVVASRYAAEKKWADALLLNTYGRVVESTKANFWLVFYPDGQNFDDARQHKAVTIITPPLSEGALRGVMRAFLLDVLSGWGYKVKEQAIAPFDLLQAREIWLTNVIAGLQTVAEVEEEGQLLHFQPFLGRKIQQLLADLM